MPSLFEFGLEEGGRAYKQRLLGPSNRENEYGEGNLSNSFECTKCEILIYHRATKIYVVVWRSFIKFRMGLTDCLWEKGSARICGIMRKGDSGVRKC